MVTRWFSTLHQTVNCLYPSQLQKRLFCLRQLHVKLIIMSEEDRRDTVFEARKLQRYRLFDGCGQNEQWFYRQSHSRHFSRNTLFYLCIDSRCEAVMHCTRRPNNLGELTFLFRKHTCNYQVHENFVDVTTYII